jgi:hypothetical protein
LTQERQYVSERNIRKSKNEYPNSKMNTKSDSKKKRALQEGLREGSENQKKIYVENIYRKEAKRTKRCKKPALENSNFPLTKK